MSSHSDLEWFARTLKKFVGLFSEALLLTITIKLLSLAAPFAVQAIVDKVLPFHREVTLNIIIICVVVVIVFEFFLGTIRDYLTQHTGRRITIELGSRIFDHTLRLPLPFFQTLSVGETMTRLREVGSVCDMLTGTIMGIFLDVIFSLIYLTVLFLISAKLAIFVLAAIPLQGGLYLLTGPLLRKRLQASFHAGALHQGRLVETLTDITNIKALGIEGKGLSRLKASLANVLNANFRADLVQIMTSNINDVIGKLLSLCVIYFGAGMVLEGTLTLGQLLTFHLISRNIAGPVQNLSTLWETWQQLQVSRLRIGDVLGQEPEAAPSILSKERGRADGSLKFEDVTFTYDSLERPVFSHLNLLIPAGGVNVLIGPSGSGKSTLAHLACGLIVPSSGKVSIDNYDIAELELYWLRKQIAYVPQDPILWNATIEENLRLANPLATTSELEQALDIVSGLEMISGMPDGLSTEVGERGQRLSGGQRQRVALARAYLKSTAVLIFDEPTSALDVDAQAHLAKNVSLIAKDRTLVLITHSPELISLGDHLTELNADGTAFWTHNAQDEQQSQEVHAPKC